MAKKSKTSRKVAVLGGGRVGKAIALDLAESCDVRVVDANGDALAHLTSRGLKTVAGDATDAEALSPLIADCDLVINAVPGHLGFRVLKNVIRCGRRIVDISFFPEDPFKLDSLARKNGVIAVVDCGVAPGFSNMALGRHCREMAVEDFVCYVGGLPKTRVWPYQYKAPFSPIDVIEEYVRPARMMENRVVVTKPALSELEHLDFGELGTLEAFNTDGLRTLLKTVKVPNMREKTLRYPGHSEYMKVLRDTGFFDTKPVRIKGVEISPIELTARVLFPQWQLAEGEEEFTVMRIRIAGNVKGGRVVHSYEMRDDYDKDSGLTSMARTTGYTCTAVAHMMLEGKLKGGGITPPEFIGMDKAKFERVTDYLTGKGIVIEHAQE